jgi:hypothetical protein
MNPGMSETRPRVLVQALRISRDTNRLDIAEVAVAAKTTEKMVRRVLFPFLSIMNDEFLVTPGAKVQLGLELARTGRLRDGANALSWREFEDFCGECLEEAGFKAQMNVRVRGEGRAWQIDIVGFRGNLVLTIDCKHWNTPSYLSRYRLPATHSRLATAHLLASLVKEEDWENRVPVGLPVILCLMEPPNRFFQRTLLVSVEKLPEFLSTVTPYDPDLPFIHGAPAHVENPIS